MAKKNSADIAAEENLQRERRLYKKEENFLTVLVFLAFLFGLLALFVLLPDRAYSKTENKELQRLPEFSFSALFKGTFTKDAVEYIKDQFPAKTRFVELNAVYNIVSGQMGSGGVILGSDGYLLTEEAYASAEDIQQLHRYERIVSAFSKKLPAVVAVAGKGSQVLTDKLPDIFSTDAAIYNHELIKNAFEGEDKTYKFLDLAEVLAAHRSEDIYYRTDHHWTTLGAFYGSAAISEALGKTPRRLEDYRRETVSESFRGTIYNRSGMFWKSGEKMEYFRYDGDEDYTVSFCSADGKVLSVSHSLYNLSCFEKDYHGTAYDSFVAPVSTPVVRIRKSGEERPTLLVLKDSFAHSALSFLARDYDILSVDIRTNADYAAKLIEEGAVDALLVLVNSDTLLG